MATAEDGVAAAESTTSHTATNYDKWDMLDLSDDEDVSDCHPNIDGKLWLRLKKEKQHRKWQEEDAELHALEQEMAARKKKLGDVEAEIQRLLQQRQQQLMSGGGLAGGGYTGEQQQMPLNQSNGSRRGSANDGRQNKENPNAPKAYMGEENVMREYEQLMQKQRELNMMMGGSGGFMDQQQMMMNQQGMGMNGMEGMGMNQMSMQGQMNQMNMMQGNTMQGNMQGQGQMSMGGGYPNQGMGQMNMQQPQMNMMGGNMMGGQSGQGQFR